jgi:phosphate:Na+ symporter
MQIIYIILQVAGSLGMFLYGIKKMSDGLQKTAGKKMKNVLNFMTGNRFTAIITGIVITALINSSSATTVMVVSFVNAGLMNLVQAIGVILGANIGTTVTGWIMATLGFSMDITNIAIVLIGLGLPLFFSKKTRQKDFGEILFGAGFLFLGLKYLQSSMPDISGNVAVLSFLERMNDGSIGTVILCVLIGMVLTMIVQSSAAAMAITLTMAYQGWVGVTASCALVLGQNIGTTITAFLASIGTSTNAKRAAWAHILFNLIGSILAIILLKWMMAFVNMLTPGDIYTMQGEELYATIPTYLAMFHTMFNVINTILFTPFIKQYAAFITRIIPNKKDYEDSSYHFKYVPGAIMETPEVYISAIQDEIGKMGNIATQMFESCSQALLSQDTDITETVADIKHKEDYVDQMEEQLTSICSHITGEVQDTPYGTSTSGMLRVIDEIESITDSCCDIIMLFDKKQKAGWKMSEDNVKTLSSYSNLVQQYLSFVLSHLGQKLTEGEMEMANSFEDKVNKTRTEIQKIVYGQLTNNSKNVAEQLCILDDIKHLEHIGDHCTNIAEVYFGLDKHTPKLVEME